MLELDVRVIPPPRKHPTIHEKLAELGPGEALRITNDHDPRPLRFELEHDYPNGFAWNYLESGPETWRVDIIKCPEHEVEPRLELIADSSELSVSRITLEPGASLPSHQLGDTVAIILCEGNALLSLHGRKRQLGAGAVELLTSHDTYTLEATDITEAYVLRVKRNEQQ